MTKIRRIERYDYEQVCDLLQEFAAESTIGSFKQKDYDREYAKKLLEFCCSVGVGLCACRDGKIQGILLSIKDRDIWVPNIIRLKELAWYVRPEYRMTTVGARLFSEWKKIGENLIKSGEIRSFQLTKLRSSPDFDLEKRGFKEIETHYMFGD